MADKYDFEYKISKHNIYSKELKTIIDNNPKMIPPWIANPPCHTCTISKGYER